MKTNRMAIIGNIEYLHQRLTSSRIDPVFEYLKKSFEVNSTLYKKLFSLPQDSFEKVELTDDIFAFLQVATTKPIEECFIESHRKYVDFQLLVEGIEEMHYIDINKLIVDTPYDDRKDLITYNMQTKSSKFLLESGDLAIFFPEDAHIGLSMYREPSNIKKVVVKVPLSLCEGVC